MNFFVIIIQVCQFYVLTFFGDTRDILGKPSLPLNFLTTSKGLFLTRLLPLLLLYILSIMDILENPKHDVIHNNL